MAKKKKKVESASEDMNTLEVQQMSSEVKEPEVEKEEVVSEIVAEEKPAKKAKASKRTKKESKPKVDDKRTGKIVQIFNSGMAIVEIGNVKSLMPLGNAKRYRVGDIIQLQFKQTNVAHLYAPT